MTPNERLKQLVDEHLEAPAAEGKEGSPERSLYAALIQVRWALEQLEPKEKR